MTKSKDGVVTKDRLTKQWTGWVDYLPAFEERWTGGYIFENEWQSFRTRQNRNFELTTAPRPPKNRAAAPSPSKSSTSSATTP